MSKPIKIAPSLVAGALGLAAVAVAAPAHAVPSYGYAHAVATARATDVPPYLQNAICVEYSQGKSESEIADEFNLTLNEPALAIADCVSSR